MNILAKGFLTGLAVPSLAILAAPLSGMEVGVDQPGGWHDPTVSHHGKHGWLGVGTGAVGWTGAYLLDADQATRCTVGISLGFAVGFGYELVHAKGSTLLDPVDALWVIAGSVLSVSLAEIGLVEFTVQPTRDGAALGYSRSF
jgi:hypothetical protein